jgi:uncharacterized SAM-binding protein YcdF (DUF218 family)
VPRRRFLRLVVLFALVVVTAAAITASIPAVAAWLVVADPLQPSDAIFVLEGRTPAREVEAAAVYHRGLAPIVALSHARDPLSIARRLARLPPGQDTASVALRNLGVPDRAILRLEPEVENTVEELAVIADVSRARGFRRIILVSSPSHTRRIRMIWDARPRGVAASVYPTSYETFDPHRWWRSRHGVETMLHELGGIVNFKLGSVLPTFDEGPANR